MKKSLLIICIACIVTSLSAQKRQIEEVDYRRSSIYSLLINHTEQHYGPNVAQAFISIPLPDKYNDHDLSVKIITVDDRTPKEERGQDFLERNNVASHLVAKWFDRNPLTGECNMELVKKRGLYNASEFDRQLAARTLRGNAMLEDAGEDLIHNTFVIVNDIRYVDKEKAGEIAGMILHITLAVVGTIAGVVTGNSNMVNGFSDLGEGMNKLMQTLKGFKVKVNTHLYRLAWTEEMAAQFYENMYSEVPDEEKKQYFETHRSLFKLEYIGSQLSSGSDVSFIGVNLSTPEEMIRKACVRAIDENVANLAKNFEPFKVKTRLSNDNPLQAPIGMKEEITENSRFEVLEATLQDGKMEYRHVAYIKPIRGMIWDNRYMAVEEGASGSSLHATTFEKIGGGQIHKGMLIREVNN